MEPEVRTPLVHYHELDILRFLAALSVVFFHFTYRGYHADNLSPVAYSTLSQVTKYGYLGVEFFFIISGYVISISAQGKTLKQFLVSRVSRLYPAYWLACTVTLVVVRALGPSVHAPGWSPILDAPLDGYLVNLTMLQGFLGVNNLDGVAWSLTLELAFYGWIALLIYLNGFRYLVPILSTWLVCCAITGPVFNMGPVSLLLFPRYAPFFVAGMAFYWLQTKQAPAWQLYALLAGAYLLGLRTARTNAMEAAQAFHDSTSLLITAGIITACFGLFFLLIFGKLRVGKSAWGTLAGGISYPLYLLHHNIGYVALQHLGGQFNKYWLLAALLASVLVLAYLVHSLVEVPASAWLRRKLKTTH